MVFGTSYIPTDIGYAFCLDSFKTFIFISMVSMGNTFPGVTCFQSLWNKIISDCTPHSCQIPASASKMSMFYRPLDAKHMSRYNLIVCDPTETHRTSYYM